MIFQPVIAGKKLPSLTSPGSAADLLAGKQLIDADGNVLTGTMASVSHPAPTISVSSAGLITASHAQSEGKVEAGTTQATRQLTTQAGKTVTPGTTQQTAVASGRYTTGAVYVAGDADLKAANIKSGVNIFGVTGTYAGATFVDDGFSISPRSTGSDGVQSITITSPVAGSRILFFAFGNRNTSGNRFNTTVTYFKASATSGFVYYVDCSSASNRQPLDAVNPSSWGTSFTLYLTLPVYYNIVNDYNFYFVAYYV